MSQNKKLKVGMQLVLAVSSTGIATILYNAPVGAVDYVAPDYVSASSNGTIGADGKAIVGTARAQILQQITQAQITNLDFGKVVPSATSGTITVDSSGSVTNTGGARYIPSTGAQNATLSFTGQPNQNIKIEADSTVTITNGSDATKTMEVALNYPGVTPAGGIATINTSVPSSGNYSLNYGGTLSVGAGQTAGIYTGTYDIYVTYVA